MEKRNQSYNIEDLVEKIEKGKLTFDYPIQREDGQWDKSQKALLIDSVLNGYFIPDVYIIKEGTEDFSPMSVLDGKQRLTTLQEYVNDGFALPKDMDDVTITDVSYDEEKNPIITETTHKIAGKKFSKLDSELQKIFNKYKIEVKLLAGYSDEQIEEQFYRLNNGCTFTKSQKANVKVGTKLAGEIKSIEDSEFFQNRAMFTNSQKKRGEIKSCILQTMMILSGYDYKNFGANEVLRFAREFSDNPDYDVVSRTKELFEKLPEMLPEHDEDLDKNLKKINIPIIVNNMDVADKSEKCITNKEYKAFLNDWLSAEMVCGNYMSFCGQGSVSRAKVVGRIACMNDAMEEFMDSLS
jgi:hypothetical protein